MTGIFYLYSITNDSRIPCMDVLPIVEKSSNIKVDGYLKMFDRWTSVDGCNGDWGTSARR